MIAIIGPLSALRACGRFIVTIRTWPRNSMSACGCSRPGGSGPGRAAESAGVEGTAEASLTAQQMLVTAPRMVVTALRILRCLPFWGVWLLRTITRSTFIPMALNIADLFEHAADAVPERLAIACDDNEITYRALEARSNQLAHYLASAGVGRGDHVGVYGRNSIELVTPFLASYKLRAIA